MTQASNGRSVMVQGRIVWVAGKLFEGKKQTIFGTNQPMMDQKTGEQKVQYGFGLAVPKSILAQAAAGQPGEIWSSMYEEAFTLFPNRQIPPAFAMKFKDGDGIDDKGQSFAQREGYAGNIVFSLTTSLPIKFFKFENGANVQVNEGIKCGDYVQVQVNIKAHPAIGAGKAGLYMNPQAVRFLAYGKEIINAPSGDQIFGTDAPLIPAGGSAMPIAPVAPMPGAPMAPPAQPMGVPTPQPAPHFAVLPGQFQPPPGGQPMGAPAMPPMPTAPGGYPVPQ